MAYRLTEAQLKAYQTRRAAKAAAVERKADKYDLQKHIVNALDMGMRGRPGSPLIVTLKHGLKAIQREDSNPKPYERIEQAIALLWLECTAPEAFALTTANPMGGYRPHGAGGQIRGEGAKHGYPDLLMDMPRQGYHGLRVEMKKYAVSAMPTSDQHEWLTKLSAQGYRAVLCRGHQAAIQVFSTYLSIPVPAFAHDLPGWTVEPY